jgi:hypothetical protein
LFDTVHKSKKKDSQRVVIKEEIKEDVVSPKETGTPC